MPSWLHHCIPSFEHAPAGGRHQWKILLIKKPTVFSVQCSLGSSQHFWTVTCTESQWSNTPNKKDDTNLSALLLWYLLTLLHWDLCTLLRGHLPASGLRHLKNMLRQVRATRGRRTATYIGTDFLGGRAAALLWNLFAGLKRHLVALGVRHLCGVSFKISEWRYKSTHRCANVLRELVAVGTGLLPGRIVLIQDLRHI